MTDEINKNIREKKIEKWNKNKIYLKKEERNTFKATNSENFCSGLFQDTPKRL